MKEIIHDNIWDFGRTISIVLDGGNALCTVTLLDGDEEAMLSGVIVHPTARKRGLGNCLLETAERVTTEMLKVNTIILEVKECTWMSKWYERRGYKTINNFHGMNTMRKYLN